MAKRTGKDKDWTHAELLLWCCERILESLMQGRFREGVALAMDQCIMWGVRNYKRQNKVK